MSRKETYETRTEELLKPIAAEMNVEIYDVDFAKEAGEYYLRAFIDKGRRSEYRGLRGGQQEIIRCTG